MGNRTYTQISFSERQIIERLYNIEHLSITAIAKATARNQSSISRELVRGNTGSCTADGQPIYSAELAQKIADKKSAVKYANLTKASYKRNADPERIAKLKKMRGWD